MGVEVCTVWAPRPEHEKWRDYLPLLRLQKTTAEKFGHKHVVVTDVDLPGFNTLRVELPQSLMKAMISGVIERLKLPTPDDIAFLDCDVLIHRNLQDAFGPWGLGLTNRAGNEKAPINNGAMYFRSDQREPALAFFEKALTLCGDHWGGDQEAISAAAQPIPDGQGLFYRDGLALMFLSMRQHNAVPKMVARRHHGDVFVVHFKGEVAKDWMEEYANSFILGK
jgi:hypothetical protein